MRENPGCKKKKGFEVRVRFEPNLPNFDIRSAFYTLILGISNSFFFEFFQNQNLFNLQL